MPTLKYLGKTEPIPRSLREAPDCSPRWRLDVVERYLTEIGGNANSAPALSEILRREKDFYVRQLLILHTGGDCVNKSAISYALRCYRSHDENSVAGMIAAMVIAGRSAREIALQIGTKPDYVVACEKIFFDVRRYRRNQAWLKSLCYLGRSHWLGRGACARWLITAIERGWPGLAASISNANADPLREGNREVDRICKSLINRLADFFTMMELKGVEPSAEEAKIFLPIGEFLQGEKADNFSKLHDPEPRTWEQKIKREEAARIVQGISLPVRRRLREWLDARVSEAEAEVEAEAQAPDGAEGPPSSSQQ